MKNKTSFTRIAKFSLLTGLIILLAAAGIFAQRAFAAKQETPAAASPLHPTFALLDDSGANVLQSGGAVSTLQTCGQCHDTAYISSHSFHVDLGQSDQGSTSGSLLPWETSGGLYGGWDSLRYRYLSPEGDSRTDLTNETWVTFNAARLVGGGPASSSGMEMNCFLCHLTSPNNPERVAAVEAGQGEWAASATLVGTGIVEGSSTGGYTWNSAAFDEDGKLTAPYITIHDPTNENCGQCHGLVHTDPEEPLTLTGCDLDQTQTSVTGQVISGQRISVSGMNLADKDSLSRSWDIHAERGLNCTDCHYSLNNPAYYQAGDENKPGHLVFDPRRLEIGEFLQMPNHNFARGESAQYNVAPELKGTMRRCESCHDASGHASWLPYADRHMSEVACETCHIPQIYAPAVESYDWTVLTASAQPASTCRGVEPGPAEGSIDDLVTGFQPVLMQRTNLDGDKLLAPYNLTLTWYWVYESPEGLRPVREEDLQAAWLKDGAYAPEILAGFDANNDGAISESELRIDTDAKQTLVAARLAALGLSNPRIQGQVQPYSINHNVTRGEWVTRDCQACHGDNSRLSAAMPLSDYLPGGVMPEFAQSGNASATNGLSVENGKLVYTPDTSEYGLYVFGHNRVNWVDWLGSLFFIGALLGVAGHGSLRFYRAMRAHKHGAATQRVYMYSIYERFWHWLQTFTIIILIFTGLVIHRPDMFGWLSFPYMVTIHNVLAAILVINAALSLFYHLVSGEIQQFIPRPYGFFDQAIVQAKFYLTGIFKGDPHPFAKTPDRKMNPLQQATYFGILNVLLPLQIITGALMWGAQRWPQLSGMLGGLPFLAPFHSLVAWTFAAFIVGHVYLTTTGHEPMAGIKAMINGWEETEAHASDSQPDSASPVVSA